MDEKSILKRLRNRDEKAFEEIIDLYSAYVTAIVRNLLSSKGTKEDVEEVVADTFISLWNTVERINYEEYSSIKAYIAVIARNKAKDWLRSAKVQNLQLMDDILIIDNSVEQLIVQREQQRIIARILERLKPLDWKIFVAYYYQYKKVNEIAQELQMNPQTVKTRLRRGREVLKLIEYVKDRPGHDRRYAINPQKISSELGWKPNYDIKNGMKATLDWYKNNQDWWRKILQNS